MFELFQLCLGQGLGAIEKVPKFISWFSEIVRVTLFGTYCIGERSNRSGRVRQGQAGSGRVRQGQAGSGKGQARVRQGSGEHETWSQNGVGQPDPGPAHQEPRKPYWWSVVQSIGTSYLNIQQSSDVLNYFRGYKKACKIIHNVADFPIIVGNIRDGCIGQGSYPL